MNDILFESGLLKIERELYAVEGEALKFTHSINDDAMPISGEILSCVLDGKKLWKSIFEPGSGGSSDIMALNQAIVIVVRGAGYWVPIKRPSNYEVIPLNPVKKTIFSESQHLAVLFDYTCVAAYDSKGMKWVTSDLSWDGLRNVRVENETVLGEGWSAPLGDWLNFAVDLKSGCVTGGAYNSS